MIFSTVHRCKGMEYDEVTLLNDFITEEKLKKYISQYGGDKINEQDKNRLTEEINILYVAVTRAKNKLKIPPEINPLQSLELTHQQQAIITLPNKYQRDSYVDKWNLYEASSKKEVKSSYAKTGNYGKPWTDEDRDKAAKLFTNGIHIKEIARQLSRGENGVRMKLTNMGLLDEGEPF